MVHEKDVTKKGAIMTKMNFSEKGSNESKQNAVSIAFVHHKGGTGKTTSCINTAGWLSKTGRKVLVVDMDPQGNATAGLGVDRTSIDDSIYDVLFGARKMGEIILETGSGVYLAPSSLDLLAAETHMAGKISNTTILKNKLADVNDYFDYILIDVPPGSTLLMISGIVASENIIIPLDAGVFSYETLETLKTLIVDLHKEVGIETNVMMLILKGYSSTFLDMLLTREIKGLSKEFLKENGLESVDIFGVPFSRKIYKAQMRGMPISHYAPYSDAGRAYKKIAKYVMCASM